MNGRITGKVFTVCSVSSAKECTKQRGHYGTWTCGAGERSLSHRGPPGPAKVVLAADDIVAQAVAHPVWAISMFSDRIDSVQSCEEPDPYLAALLDNMLELYFCIIRDNSNHCTEACLLITIQSEFQLGCFLYMGQGLHSAYDAEVLERCSNIGILAFIVVGFG